MIVSNIGITPDFSAIYTSNSGQHTAFVQVSLKKGHSKSSFVYMDLVRAKLRDDLPELTTYFQTGGLVDAVVNLGLPAPIDIQVEGNNLKEAYATASSLASQIRNLKGVSDVLIPQDLDYPGLELDVNREMAGRLGLDSSEIVDNVITALTSNGMIAPSYYVDPKNGNNYLLTVQFPTSSPSPTSSRFPYALATEQWPQTWVPLQAYGPSKLRPRLTTTRSKGRSTCMSRRRAKIWVVFPGELTE